MATGPSSRNRKTPGVYVTELPAFPPSIVGVQTAVPVFIGYTEKADISGESIYLKPTKIGSLADYEALFGGAFPLKWHIAAGTPTDCDFEVVDGGVTSYYKLERAGASGFLLYNSLRMFFANGGGACFIVSVGDYTDNGASGDGRTVAEADLLRGLDVAGDQVGPTMTVIPDAVLLPSAGETTYGVPRSGDYQRVVKAMLAQCGRLQDRVAILDVYGTQVLSQDGSGEFALQLDDAVRQLWEDVGDDDLGYGMVYFPFLDTTIVSPDEIDYTHFVDQGGTKLSDLLTVQAAQLYQGARKEAVDELIAAMASTTEPLEAVTELNNTLRSSLPLLVSVENIAAMKSGLLPPCGAMAGIFTRIDETRGVWNAPANTSLTAVRGVSVNLTDAHQGDLNVPLNGKAIDVIREFAGRGTVVWGARTLDGNSNDYRYIQIRRTLIYIEQSIKLALDQFVFAANDGKTWVAVESMISNFLQGLWSQGGLMGATASQSFTVECGLGSTMTALDVLEGYMIVEVRLALTRPAEFIGLTFKQKMEGSA